MSEESRDLSRDVTIHSTHHTATCCTVVCSVVVLPVIFEILQPTINFVFQLFQIVINSRCATETYIFLRSFVPVNNPALFVSPVRNGKRTKKPTSSSSKEQVEKPSAPEETSGVSCNSRGRHSLNYFEGAFFK